MVEKFKKHQRLFLVILIVICMGIIVAGGVHYLEKLRGNLADNAIQDVMNVTLQQNQAFNSFVSSDRERLHGYTEYFTNKAPSSPEEVQQLLTLFKGVDTACVVMCLDEGWACCNLYDEILQLDAELLSVYRSLPDAGVRDSFAGMFSGIQRFGYYETFTFKDGHKGLIEKGFGRSQILETFTLSLYNGQGYGYILDQNGDILLRSVSMTGNRVYENVFDALTDTHNPQDDIDAFKAAMDAQETGSIVFGGDKGEFIYTYVPVESVDGWYLLSIVPADAIRAEGDQMLRDTRMTLFLFAVALVFCAVFILLIWRTQKEIRDKDQAFNYQAQVTDIFFTYLSRNTNNVYMLLDAADVRVEYVSSNLKRVFGISEEQLISGLQSLEGTSTTGEEISLERVCRMEPGAEIEAVSAEWTNPETQEHKWFQGDVYCVQVQGRNKVVIHISDLTRERKVQHDLAEALSMAKAANAAKSAFLSSVSHDIRTPMNAITGFLALMVNEADDPRVVREYAQRIDAASQHLLGLINDVLDMNKIESGSTTLNISEMDLAEVIDEINTIIRPQSKAKNQTFDIFASHLTYEHLLGDKMRINQILINLLSNAVKYTQEGGAIEMRVEELSQVVSDYSRVRFTISDNGLGMSEDYLKVIFEPFTREETKVTHKIQGTGLGMAITKSLVDLMGGSIHVESELGKGSTFTVELELRIQEREEREDDPRFWHDHSVARMITVDDDEGICQTIVKAMARTGVVTDYATDGKTAVQMMRSTREAGRPYDLILLDWQMPDLDGLETARLIRKNYSEKIPILLLTAYDWSEIEQEATEVGVNHFMPKPFFMSTFKEAIRRVMGSAKQKEEIQSDVVRGKHILVVDDIEVNQIILAKILSSLGADCDTASNGQEALDKFLASQPGEYDLILMDVQMPVMDGYEATRAIRGSSHPLAKAIPIIAMTANAFVDDVRDAIESGMDAHIAKPVQVETLKATIQQVLDSQLERVKEP